jgi:hypothetical protein
VENQIVEVPVSEKVSGKGAADKNRAEATKANVSVRERAGEWISFNIHDRVRMGVDVGAPTAALIRDMFAPFLVDSNDRGGESSIYDLEIYGELEEMVEGTYGEVHGETDFHYNDKGIDMEATNVQVFKEGDRFRLNGQQELLVMALPLIDRLMVTKGAAMIHALTVDYRGHGICIPAWGGVGKTSTVAKLLKMDGYSFMGDDWAFLSEQSELLGYAKPMFIKPYHRPIYPHLFEKLHKPLVPIKLSKRIASMTTLVHPFVTRYPQVASFVRRWSPEHMMVTPQTAFPAAKFSTKAPVAAAMFIERYDSRSGKAIFEEKDTNWMVSQMVGNFNAEVPRQSRVVMTALGAAGLVPIEQAYEEKRAILQKSLRDKPAYLLRVPKVFPPDQASDLIVKHIQEVIGCAGI